MKLLFFCKNKAHLIFSLQLLIALTFITVLTSCHKVDIQDSSIPDAIDEYRTFYEEQMHKNGTKGNSKVPLRSPKWEKATIKNWYRGSAAVSPLDYEKDYFIRISTSPYNMNSEAVSFLVVNKGRDGSMQGEIVYIITDGLSSQSNQGGKPTFSGTIVVESLHGEFITAYVCQPDGKVLRYGDSDGTASPKNVDSKGEECLIYEQWQKTSIDGGETWSDPELLYSYEICYYVPDYYYATAVEYYDLGGGGSGGTSEDESSTIQSARPLNADELVTLESVRIIISQDCATNNVVNTVWGSLSFNVDGSISDPAQYNPNNNTITFRNSSSINANNILEELFHAYQNTIYHGGAGQYSKFKPGWTNLEFEAKLLKHLITASSGTGSWSGDIGFPNQQMGEYGIWVIQIANEGFTPTLMVQYTTMLGYFNQYNNLYGGYLLSDLDTPLAIIQSRYGCN
jgi:hypothetical protein